MKKLLVITVLTIITFSCAKMNPDNSSQVKLKDNLYQDYTPALKYESHLNNNTPSSNEITNAGVVLGRVLFYDTRLSVLNTTACASCHEQERAFADGKQFSTGFEGGLTSRNSMALSNLINSDELFWDGRTPTLEQLALEPVSHPVEMGFEKIELLPKKLELIDYYKPLFQQAYGSTEITKEKIAQALAQFLRSMVSYSSPFDGTPLPVGSWWSSPSSFSVSQKSGLQLFNNAGCRNCHNGPNVGGTTFENIGLDIAYSDPGQGNIGSTKEGFFKVPSLRNIELTAPYMHDGRFATLKDVLRHYSDNIQPHPNLAPILTNAGWNNPNDHSPIKFNFSEQDISDLEAFLNTLTDKNFIQDERFSDPFEVH